MRVTFLVLIQEPMQVLLRILEHTHKDLVVTMLVDMLDLHHTLVHTHKDSVATMLVDM
jgi:hypothetical protein